MTFEGVPQKGWFFVRTAASLLGFALFGCLAAHAQEAGTADPADFHATIRHCPTNPFQGFPFGHYRFQSSSALKYEEI